MTEVSTNQTFNVSTQSEFEAALVAQATINLVADIHTTSTIYIDGINGLKINGNGFKIDGQSSGFRMFYVTNCNRMELRDLTIANGLLTGSSQAAPAMYISNSNIDFERCLITGHATTGFSADAGAFIIYSGSVVRMTLCIFEDNRSNDFAGAVYMASSSTLYLIACKFLRHSTVFYGGAIYIASGNKVYSYGTQFEDNSGRDGADVYRKNGGTFSASSCPSGYYGSEDGSLSCE